jgi:hypothetical protein
MASAGSVTVDFDAKSARFAAELEKVQGSLKRIEGSAASLARGLNLLSGVLSAGVVLNYAKAMFQAADALGDAAARSGVAVESLSRLKFVASQSDVEFGALTVGIRKFQLGLSEASSGSASAVRSFAAVGVEVQKIRNLPLEEQLAAIADGFKNVRNPADQTRIAIDLFGKSGGELVPLLKLGAAGMKDLANEADRLGVTLSGSTVAGIGAADQAIKKLYAAFGGFAQNLIGDLAVGIFKSTLSEADQLSLKLKDLNTRRSQLEFGVNAGGRGFADELVRVNKEIAAITDRLRILQAIESYKTITGDGPGGRGRTGGGRGVTSTGEFVPFKADEVSDSTGLDLNDFLSPEARAQNLALIAQQATLARQADLQEFASFESIKAQIFAETQQKNAAAFEAFQLAEQNMRLQTTNLALGLLNSLGVKSKAAAIAAVLLNRGLSISQAVQNTAVAVTRALSVDPTGALAARVAALGKIQIGIIAATGAIQVGNIAGGDAGGIGGTTLGTPFNPLPTADRADAVGASGRAATTIYLNGNFAGPESAKWIVNEIRAAMDRDVVIIPSNSRQAIDLRNN